MSCFGKMNYCNFRNVSLSSTCKWWTCFLHQIEFLKLHSQKSTLYYGLLEKTISDLQKITNNII